MARSREAKPEKRVSRWIIAIPLIALAVIALVFVAWSLSQGAAPSAAVDFTDQIYVTVSSKTNSSVFGVIHPNRAIGEPGGIWGTHQFDANGLGNYYPLYMDNPVYACPNTQGACTFHVKSKVVHSYTLGDFMAVWGYPVVSQNYTLGVKAGGTSVWQICIGATPSQSVVDTQWGAMTLVPQLAITLTYYDTANSFGCAAS